MSIRIVLADDESIIRMDLKEMLTSLGYVVVGEAGNGITAVSLARELRPDLVIMDIQMPWISGLELIEQLKADESLKDIPIMAVTAYAGAGDEDRVRGAGVQAYVSKPISVARFVEEVSTLLKEKSVPVG